MMGNSGHSGAGGGAGGFDPMFVAVGALAVVCIGSGATWAAALATALLSGNGWHADTAGQAASFTAHLIGSLNAGGAWRQAAPHAGPLGPVWLFWPLLLLLWAMLGFVFVRVVLAYRERSLKHAGAQWARRRQEKQLAVSKDPAERPGRITAGHGDKTKRLLAAHPGASATVFGTNGSGKTVSLVVPNALEWMGPAVITTTKAPDLEYMLTRRRQIAEGDNVYIVAPTGAPGFSTACWSPVSYATDQITASQMARWLCEAATIGDPRAKPWIAQARSYIGPLLLAANRSNGGIESFMDWIARGQEAAPEVTDILRKGGFISAMRQYNSTWSLHPDGIGSVKFTTNVLIDAYQDPQARAAAARSDFTVDDILEGRGTLFLVTPLTEVEQFAPIYTTLIASIVHGAIKKYEKINERRPPGTAPQPINPRLGLLLDEAGNVFRYEGLAQLLTNARGFGITLLTVWHDLAQLRGLYGTDAAQTIVSQSRMRMLLPGMADPDTLKFFSELLGETLVDRPSHTSGQHGHSVSTSLQKEHLAAPYQLIQMKRGQALIQYENLPPMRIKLRNAESDKPLLSLAKGQDNSNHHGRPGRRLPGGSGFKVSPIKAPR